jgi:hypothetical protein
MNWGYFSRVGKSKIASSNMTRLSILVERRSREPHEYLLFEQKTMTRYDVSTASKDGPNHLSVNFLYQIENAQILHLFMT